MKLYLVSLPVPLVADLVRVDFVLDQLFQEELFEPEVARHQLALRQVQLVVRGEDVLALLEQELCEVRVSLQVALFALDELLQVPHQNVVHVQRVVELSGSRVPTLD